VEQVTRNHPSNINGQRSPHAVDKWTGPQPEVDEQLAEWRTRSKEEDEKRLREKEQQLHILQVINLTFFCLVLGVY